MALYRGISKASDWFAFHRASHGVHGIGRDKVRTKHSNPFRLQQDSPCEYSGVQIF